MCIQFVPGVGHRLLLSDLAELRGIRPSPMLYERGPVISALNLNGRLAQRLSPLPYLYTN
jgi:hypothetical protein